MYRPSHGRLAGRLPSSLSPNRVAPGVAKQVVGKRQALRARGWGQTNARDPFMPPEDWHEPTEAGRGYRIIEQSPGNGFRHVVTPQEIRERLALLPESFTRKLEVVQLSRMTRKKRGMPLYGMQWGTSLYLYPIEETLTETYDTPPKPSQLNEARMYGGRWVQQGRNHWDLVWTEEAVRDFYLNNILLHELGHLLDDRNTRSADRERYAEWFAVQYGYLPTQAMRQAGRSRTTVVRHG